MFEKLLLAVTITFSLNLFLEARAPNQVDANRQPIQKPTTILVRIEKNSNPNTSQIDQLR